MTHRDATPSRGTGPGRTERELAQALEALAGGVTPAPDAYRTARGEWLRRERRRRLVLGVLIVVVFTLATLIGLWVLNQTPSEPGVVFSGAGGGTAHASLARPRP
jgi:predicted alternative tryptophan synthase beta-subunit